MTFFSGTDWSQLHDRALESNYFMMLITNFKNEHIAKVAFKAKSKTTSSGLSFANDVENSFGELDFENENEKEVLVVMDCTVEVEPIQTQIDVRDLKQVFQQLSKTPTCDKTDLENLIKLFNEKISRIDVDKSFEERYNHVCEATKPTLSTSCGTIRPGYKSPVQDSYNRNYGYQQDLWGRFDEPINKSQRREKSLMEMTDKEWEEYIGKKDVPELMGKREGFILLNKFLDKGGLKDATSPIDKLINLNNKLKTKEEVYQWASSLNYCFRDLFDSTFPNGDDADFENILEELIEYFSGFLYNRIIVELVDSLGEMFDYSIKQ